MTIALDPSVLGLHVRGNLGDRTYYTDRYARKISYPRGPETKPVTWARWRQRERFRLAMEAWSSLSLTERRAYQDAARKASLPFCGQSLWLAGALGTKRDPIPAIARQTGIPLVLPTFIPGPP